jgi:hypothetical protein
LSPRHAARLRARRRGCRAAAHPRRGCRAARRPGGRAAERAVLRGCAAPGSGDRVEGGDDLALEQCDCAQRLVVGDVAEGEVRAEVVDAGFVGLRGDVLACLRRRPGEAAAGVVPVDEVLGQDAVQRRRYVVLAPKEVDVLEPQAVGAPGGRHRLVGRLGDDDEPRHAHQRQLVRRTTQCLPLLAVAVGDRPDHRRRQQRHGIDSVLRRPGRPLGPRDAEPQRRVRALDGREVHGHGVEVVVTAVMGELLGAQSLEQDVEALLEALTPSVPVDAQEADLDGRDAGPDAEL